MSAPPIEPTSTRGPLPGFGVAWLVFWVLMMTIAVQEHQRNGGITYWQPLLWEGSSCVVASVIVWAQWRGARRADALLARPLHWFVRAVRWLPLLAPGFVAAVFTLRHVAYALVGRIYLHDPWPQVFRFEMLKFSVFYLLFAAVVFGVRSNLALADARIRIEREQRLAQHAQLLQLAQRIEPHFLFNALNTIAATIHSDPDLADTLLTRLAALLRAATDLASSPETTLEDELRLLEGYVSIMLQRFADRVDVRLHVDPTLHGCRVPTLLLQPLLENAFRHGVERRSQPTTIAVRVSRVGAQLRLEVEDDAGVFDDPAPRFGVGLSNLRDRLQARYGESASLVLIGREPAGVLARIELPCEC